MDRRNFFKACIAVPLLTKLALPSGTARGTTELYLITDSPEQYLPSLLGELNSYDMIPGSTFNFLNTHPQEKKIKNALFLNGFQQAPRASRAVLSLSFASLRQKAAPSFALTKKGKVLDIRTRQLYDLWKKMNGFHVSSCLTTLTIHSNREFPLPGRKVSIFIDGKKAALLSLSENQHKTYRTPKGKIAVVIENGQAWVSESSCEHKICLSLPPASHSGDRIVCAPSRFLLEIQRSRFVDTVIG